jgi:pyrroline-5-carboxylate reductase
MKGLILGAGKMSEAILTGLMGKVDLSLWEIFSPSGTTALKLAQKCGANYLESLENAGNYDFILIGCKPQQIKDLGLMLKARFKHVLALSLLAAVPEDSQRTILGFDRLVRVMPNLNVGLGEGVTLLSSKSSDLTLAIELFSSLGMVHTCLENELEELTLLTGSGPALFYEFTQLLAQSFSSGSPEIRERLARKVLLGAGLQARTSLAELNQLIGDVTSKGGVTVAVLEEWRRLKLGDLLASGVKAGVKRASEIKTTLQS